MNENSKIPTRAEAGAGHMGSGTPQASLCLVSESSQPSLLDLPRGPRARVVLRK